MQVHDHFDGSYRCVQCDGPCKLKGSDLFATQLVRMLLERCAINGWNKLPMYEEHMLTDQGIDVTKLYRRAKETTPMPTKRPAANHKDPTHAD